MRLIKRRSTTAIEHDQLPSSISLVDLGLGDPGVVSTSTTLSSPPSLFQHHSELDVRLLKTYPTLPSASASASTPRSHPNPKLRLENPNRPGTEHLDGDAHITRTGRWNVSTASADTNTNAHENGEDPRRAGDVSPTTDGIDDTIAGTKRNSGGQNRYPPNSLVPGNGWGFGLMRRTRKQDMAIVPPLPLRRDSLR